MENIFCKKNGSHIAGRKEDTRVFQTFLFGIYTLFAFSVFVLSNPDNSIAQGWQIYADQLKNESNLLKEEERKPAETVSPELPLSEDISGTENRLERNEDIREETQSFEAEEDPAIPYAEPFDPSLLSTAALHDICMSSPNVLWAVGDRGTLWTTLNGGNKWMLVKVPTRAHLFSVSFADSQIGLIAGGSVIPGTPNGKGIILRTEDGGRTWNSADISSFPILRQICFREDGTAEAWGDSSELYPSGHFVSSDGGQTWESVSRTNSHPGWKKGLSLPDSTAIGIGTDGIPLLETGSNCSRISSFADTAHLADLTSAGTGTIFWTGNSGTLLSGDESGHFKSVPLPSSAADFDFETVSVLGSRIDLAGTPGTRVFSSTDGGKTWNSSATGITLPLHKLFFTDAQNGWGVGEMGNIIATHDGGKTWQVQREGGRRAGWLGICENSSVLPYEWVASLSGKDGWFGVLDLITCPGQKNDFSEILPELRVRDAVLRAGGNALVQEQLFPAPPKEALLSREMILDSWNRQLKSPAKEILRERLVRALRVWRPTLLVISCEEENPFLPVSAVPQFLSSVSPDRRNPIRPAASFKRSGVDPIRLALLVEQNQNNSESVLSSPNESTLSGFLREVVEGAVRDAADPHVFPKQIIDQGLPPWKIKRIGILSKNGGTARVKTADYLSLFEESVEDTVRESRKIAHSNADTVKNFRGMEFAETEKGGRPISEPFTGLESEPGTESRRPLPLNKLTPADKPPLNRIEERRRLLAMADHFTGNTAKNKEIIRGSIDENLRSADPSTAALFLLRVGKNLTAGGDPDSANEIFERLIAEYPNEDAAREGAVFLIRSYSGIERVRRVAEGRAVQNESGPISRESIEAEEAPLLPGILDKSADAVRIGEFVQENYPELYMCPEFRFPLAAAQRRTGGIQKAVGYYYNRSANAGMENRFGILAAGEYALLNSTQETNDSEKNPLLSTICRKSAAVPYLDGILEPEVWEKAEEITLTGASDTGSGSMTDEARVFILSDQEYLYLGISAKGSFPPESDSEAPRLRDADLSRSDRIEIALDPDRDYFGYYLFTFDHRGWTSDSCQNDPGWNPQIFIANRKTTNGWTLEAAIPWIELCDTPPVSGNVWGLALRRIIPGSGIAVQKGIGSPDLQGGFGHLKFQ